MIANNEEFCIPLKKLWYGYRLLFSEQEISVEEFEQTLRKDERFLFTEGRSVQKNAQEIPDESEVMESLGFFSGPVVSLKSRQPTEDAVARNIDRTFARLLVALSRMWEARDPRDKPTEQSLSRVIDKVRTLYASFQKSRMKKSETEQT
jgi:hypothetical protein